MAFKKITFDEEMRKSLMKGVNTAVDAVAQTLGPAGRTVLIEEPFGNVTVTRDGVTVARNIQLEEPLENMGAQLIKNIASLTDDNVGDGTTTSSVLAQALLEEGLKAVSSGVNPIMLRNGMNQATEDVIKELENISKEVEDEKQITHVATISANNDEKIGALIAEAIDSVGNDGVITVGESRTIETHVDYVEGMSFDRGYISPYFCTNPDDLSVEYTEPFIFIADKRLSSTNEILKLLGEVKNAGKQMLIIAPEVEGELLTALIVNDLRQVFQICAVKAPGFGDNQRGMLEDIAILTGATVFSDETGRKITEATLDDLGMASSIKVTKDNTTIVGGQGNPDALKTRVEFLRMQAEECTSDYEKEKYQDRIAKLAGGVAVINIGDVSEAAAREKKFRVEDAISATRAAVEEGIVPGGGVALAQISKKLSGALKDVEADFARGYDIVMKSLVKPIKQIAENAGLSGEVVAQKVVESPNGFGFNALTGVYENMMEAGIIDPTKVTRNALQNAVSVASLILTSGAAVNIVPEEKNGLQPVVPGQPMM